MSFSKHHKEALEQAETIGVTPVIGKAGFRTLLEKAGSGSELALGEIVELVNGTRDPLNRRMVLDYAAGLKRPRDREILLLPPLYFASICENKCLYCNFSVSGDRLSLEEFAGEVAALLDMGYRSIELVSSQDPALYVKADDFTTDRQRFNIDGVIHYFETAAARIRERGGGMLTCNIPPVDVACLAQLKTVGLDCFLLWLETFNPDQYAKLHDPRGPKAVQAYRLDSFDSAREAGIEHLAGAFLKGLYDWRKEEVLLYWLDDYLKKKHSRGFSIIGTPRIKGRFQESELIRSYKVSDEDYILNIALDRILFDGINWLQTRESFDFNRRLLNLFGGGVILTLTCSTAPGGYRRRPRSLAQFPVYNQELADTVKRLENDGFAVHFDWDSRMLTSFLRSESRAKSSPGAFPES
ncbi:MAG: radical SAM protein [Acidobacteriota bacterium]|nr:radical SAM protein [Acidobacteriota bacterium]